MRIDFVKKLRIFLIVALVVLVVGMAMLGFLDVNRAIDDKPSYEMQVSVDQIAGESVSVLESATEKAFSDIGLKPVSYGAQKEKDGSILIYKFKSEIANEKITAVKDVVQAELDANNLSVVKADVKVYENYGNKISLGLNVILALGIASLVIFVYALIMNKLAGGVAVLSSSVLSMLLFVALMAITRIPATYWSILLGATVAFNAALSLVITTKYRAVKKADDKLSSIAVCESVNKLLRKVYIVLAVAIALSGIIAGAIGAVASIFLGLSILVAGVASMASAVYMTPLIYSLFKGKKK